MRALRLTAPSSLAPPLIALLLAACTVVPAAPASRPSVDAVPASVVPKDGEATAVATAAAARQGPATPATPATPAPVDAAVYTADDEAIARLITLGAGAAIPQLKVLNTSDPSKLEKLFGPLGIWIADQKEALVLHVASRCTADAVTQFLAGLERYDAIRKQFLAWRDWGANGNAFPPGAPREAADAFRAAVSELGTRCPA